MSETLAIGVDVGGTKILAGVVDRDGRVLRDHERRTATGSQQELIGELTAAVDELRDDSVGAIGFGIPATIDQRSGRPWASTTMRMRPRSASGARAPDAASTR
jgi:predicted NBD/HSP70 family sugar kinase